MTVSNLLYCCQFGLLQNVRFVAMSKWICVLILIPLALGCGVGDAPSDASSEIGVGKHERQIKYFITEELRLDSLQLKHTGDDNYTAEGTGADGNQYDIIVEKQPDKIEYTWKNSKGKKGKGSLRF